MPVLRRSLPWTGQPQTRVDIAGQWSGRVLSAQVGWSMYDFAARKFATFASGVPDYFVRQTTPAGTALGTTGGADAILHPGPAPESDKFVILSVFVPADTSGIQQVMALDSQAASARCFQFRLNGSTAEWYRFNTGASAYGATISSAAVAGVPLTMLGRSNGSAIDLFIPGKSASNTIVSTPKTWVAADTQYAGWGARQSGGFLEVGRHRFVLRVVIGGAVSDAEILSLVQNPWKIFAPQTRRIWVPSAGGALDITGTLGTATAAGFTANVDRQLAIAGSLGTTTASGFTANVDRQLAIAGALGTATASGFTANIDRQLAIAGTLGTATASGFDATVQFGGALNISGTLGTAAADGFNANIDQQIAIAASLGQSVADGFAAAVSNSSMTLTAGDVDAIVAAIFAQAQITPIRSTGLTLPQFLALKD